MLLSAIKVENLRKLLLLTTHFVLVENDTRLLTPNEIAFTMVLRENIQK